LQFEDFFIGQTFKSKIMITESEFRQYLSFAKTKILLHENAEIAKQEGVKGILIPGRSIIARAEGTMTRLDAFSDCIFLLYGMNCDPSWQNRHTRFIGKVYAGEELEVKYIISDKRDAKNKDYGILGIDFEITRSTDNKLVTISRRNLYRIKK